MMQLWTLLHAVPAVLLVFMLHRLSPDLKSLPRQLFFTSLVSMLLWLVSDFFLINAPTEAAATFYFVAALAFSTGAGISFYLCASSFLEKKFSAADFLLSVFLAGLLIYAVPHAQVFHSALGYQSFYVAETLAWITGLAILIGLSLYKLYRIHQRVTDPQLKTRISYFMISVFLTITLGVLFSASPPEWGIPHTAVPPVLALMLSYMAFKK